MTKNELDIFLTGATILCAALALFNLAIAKKRGWTAYLMSASFLLFGCIAFMVKAQVSNIYIQGSSVLLFLMLVTDFVFRAAKPSARKRK